MHRRVTALLACALLVVAGCAGNKSADSQAPQRPRVEPPPQVPGSLRLVIYRPQALVGMWGKPVVVINGHKLVTARNESLLEPGSVFIVDAPASLTRVGWIQFRSAQPSEDMIVFNGVEGATRFLRWTLRPTHGFLEQVSDDVANQELGPLQYMGYRNVVGTN